MDFTSQGGKIYRPRPKAEVCKFLPPRVVKSIDDRADVRQCYSHVRHYMKESQGLHWTLIENLAIYMKFILNSFLLQSFTELFFIGLNSIQRSQSKCAPASICRPISIQLKVDVVNVNRRSAPAFWSTDQSGGSRFSNGEESWPCDCLIAIGRSIETSEPTFIKEKVKDYVCSKNSWNWSCQSSMTHLKSIYAP